jgi:transposase
VSQRNRRRWVSCRSSQRRRHRMDRRRRRSRSNLPVQWCGCLRPGWRPADRSAARGSHFGVAGMINVPSGARVLLATRPIDFRKGAHGLAALAQEVLAEDPFSGAVIVWRSKRSDRVKILIWDTSGLVLIWKQLQQGSFRWPPIMDGAMRLSPVEFAALFDGLDWTRVQTTKGILKPSVAA